MQVKAGLKLRGASCATEVVVTKAPSADVSISCCGAPMVESDGQSGATGDQEATVLLGKRYIDEKSGTELLCSKAGAGPLAVDGREVGLKEAKPLPASD